MPKPPSFGPILKRYQELEQENPDKIILMKVGDFVEVFGDNAMKISDALSIYLRYSAFAGETISLAGFPSFARKEYLQKLDYGGIQYLLVDERGNRIDV